MKEYFVYIKQIIWGSLLFTWLLLNVRIAPNNDTVCAVTGVLAIAAGVFIIAAIRKRIGAEPVRCPLSDNNIATMLFVLGMGSIMDFDNADYLFLVAVTAAGIAIDAGNRYIDRNG